MKIITRNHSQSTNISDLLMILFSLAYFVSGLCFAKDLFACLLFLLCAVCIILIKYFKFSENEQ